MPSHTLLPVLLGELAHVPDDRIVILIAAGTHRPNDRAELVEMLGEPIVDRYRIVNHSAFDEDGLVHLGEVEPQVPVWLKPALGGRRLPHHHRIRGARTSSPASAAARSWWRPGWPGSGRR